MKQVPAQKSILGSNATGMQGPFLYKTQHGTAADFEEALSFLDGVNGGGLDFHFVG